MQKSTLHRANLLCVICTTAILFSLLSSCSNQPSDNYTKIDDDNVVQYTTDDAIDPQNYTTYVNKELNLVLNILSSHVTMGDSLIKEKGVISDELASVKSDLDMVAEAIESVETLHPPKDYEDDRDTILQKMVNAKASLEAYRDMLESDDISGLQDLVDLMSTDYNSLSGSFNMPWE